MVTLRVALREVIQQVFLCYECNLIGRTMGTPFSMARLTTGFYARKRASRAGFPLLRRARTPEKGIE